MQTIKQSILSIVIGLALVAGLSYAWTGPTATPPNSNASAPINVSASSQIKGGALEVNGFSNIGDSSFSRRLKILSNTPKEGRVLTSDDEGYATWRQPTPPAPTRPKVSITEFNQQVDMGQTYIGFHDYCAISYHYDSDSNDSQKIGFKVFRRGNKDSLGRDDWALENFNGYDPVTQAVCFDFI